jgi:hypothetical protein
MIYSLTNQRIFDRLTRSWGTGTVYMLEVDRTQVPPVAYGTIGEGEEERPVQGFLLKFDSEDGELIWGEWSTLEKTPGPGTIPS